VLSLIYPVLIDFDKSIIKYPNIRRFPGAKRLAAQSASPVESGAGYGSPQPATDWCWRRLTLHEDST
jgi:hypothetical protein